MRLITLQRFLILMCTSRVHQEYIKGTLKYLGASSVVRRGISEVTQGYLKSNSRVFQDTYWGPQGYLIGTS